MKVFLIQGDNSYFGASYKDRAQLRAVMDHQRKEVPLVDMGELVGWYYSGNEKEDPILTDFGFLGCAELILRLPTTEAIRPMLQEVGTIIPMTPWMGHRFEAFICETKLDALDPGGMLYFPDDGTYTGTEVRGYAFRPDVVEQAAVFRVKGLFGRLFATSRFIDAVEAHGLTGLQALPIWSNEEGTLVTFDDPGDEFQDFPPKPGNTRAERRARMRAILAERDGHP